MTENTNEPYEITQYTYGDFIRKYWSQDLTDEECDLVLWNLTGFPLVPIETIKEQLVSQYKESGGNIDLAMKTYDDYVRRELKRLREEENG